VRRRAPPGAARLRRVPRAQCFLGPAGTITRLHCDAADAHGWLAQARGRARPARRAGRAPRGAERRRAQVMGRKLVVLLPPADAAHLYPLAGEAGARQSPVDVLDADMLARWPLYARARPHAAVLAPGEALLVPAGWW